VCVNFQFVAHLYSQLRLNDVLYRDVTIFPCVPEWKNLNIVRKMLYFLAYIVILPFLMMIYLPCLQCPKTSRPKFCEKLESPFNKFLSHTGSFVIFTSLLILSSFQEKLNYNIAHQPIPLGKYIFTFFVWSRD